VTIATASPAVAGFALTAPVLVLVLGPLLMVAPLLRVPPALATPSFVPAPLLGLSWFDRVEPLGELPVPEF
jgi:hypothetical protein